MIFIKMLCMDNAEISFVDNADIFIPTSFIARLYAARYDIHSNKTHTIIIQPTVK